VGITPDGTTAFVANKGSNNVTPITVATKATGTAITVGSAPWAVATAVAPPPPLTLTVDSAGDHATGVAANCTPSAGSCTMRDAFAAASSSTSDATIVITPGLAQITLANGTLSDTSTANLTIQGNGGIVDGNNASLVINDTNGSGTTLTLDHLTVQHGNNSASSTFLCVGGVSGTNNVMVQNNSVVDANTASNCSGSVASIGGVGSTNGTVTATNSTVSNNMATTGSSQAVGGLGALGAVTVTASTISGNQATDTATGSGVAVGGAGSVGTLTVTGSTISGNTATSGGPAAGGLAGTPVTVTGSTVSGNSGTGVGGSAGGVGSGLSPSPGTATVTNSTVTGNTVADTSGHSGGGVAATHATLAYSTVASNTGPAGANTFDGDATSPPTTGGLTTFGSVIALPLGGGTNCAFQTGSTTPDGYSYSDDASCHLTGTGDHQSAADPQLGALANNGGSTLTRLPQPGSPLIDAIPSGSCQASIAAGISHDQIGTARPQGSGCDIGAVEVAVLGAPTGVAATAGDARATVSWSAPVNNGGSTISAYTVTASPGPATCATTGPLSCTVTSLTNGTNYSFSVTATNGTGPGPASAASNVVTPEPWTGTFTPVTPARILDTRNGTGAPMAKVGPAAFITLQVTGHGGVPANGVSAVVMNVTATQATQPSFLTVYPADVTQPNASNLNFTAGEDLPNLVTVKLSAGGAVKIFNGVGSVHVVADVVGWFGDATATSGARLQPVTPARILDTRNGTGAPQAPLGPGQSLNLQVTGHGGVPASGVSGVVMNVTATQGTAPSFLTVWPTGVGQPNASNLNFTAREDIPNLVSVGVGAGGQVSIYNGVGSVGVIADVVGYYSDTTVAGGARLNPVTPVRILDTRNGTGAPMGPLGPGQALTLQVGGVDGVGADATAVVMNVTSTQGTQPSFLTVWPADVAQPNASNLNFTAHEDLPNLVTVKLSPAGRVKIFNGVGSVGVVADVVGWYAP
jgi:YVTN family beta-propeller protein